jgi:hypothetical protein
MALLARLRQELAAADSTVAQTILQQLGGNKFRAMVAPKNMSYDDKTLSFHIGRNPKGIKVVKIMLNARDEYDVEFWQMKSIMDKPNIIKVTCQAGDLRKVFEQHTGLYTSLSSIIEVAIRRELTPELRKRVETSLKETEDKLVKFKDSITKGVDAERRTQLEILIKQYTQHVTKLQNALKSGHLEMSAKEDDIVNKFKPEWTRELQTHHSDLHEEHKRQAGIFNDLADKSSGRNKYLLTRLADHHSGEAMHHKSKLREAEWLQNLNDEIEQPAPKGKELPMPEPKGKSGLEDRLKSIKISPQTRFWKPGDRHSPKGKLSIVKKGPTHIAAEMVHDHHEPKQHHIPAQPNTPQHNPATPAKHQRKHKVHVKGSPTDINYFLTRGLGYDNTDEIKQWQWFIDDGILFFHDPNLDVDQEGGDGDKQTTTNWWNRLSSDDLTENKWQFSIHNLTDFLTKLGMKPINKTVKDLHYDAIKDSGDGISRTELTPFRE